MGRLYKFNRRICPCCGKKLILEPPNIYNAPKIIRTNGSKPYYVTAGKFRTKAVNKCRLFRYTSRKYKYTFVFPDSRTSDYNRDHGVYLAKAKQILEHDHIFNTSLIMFCKNCNANIAVNRNPCRLIRYYSQYPLIFMLLGALISIYWNVGLILVIFGAVAQLSMFMISLLYYIIINHFYSNFIIRDDLDRLIMPCRNLTLHISDTKRCFNNIVFSESNVLSTAFDKEIFHLYIIDTDFPKVKLHICGIEGEQGRLLALIREKQEHGEKVTLPLTFEGKFVGNGEVLETYDPPQSSTEER